MYSWTEEWGKVERLMKNGSVPTKMFLKNLQILSATELASKLSQEH